MSTESQLRDKLRKIEALYAGAGTAGERLAAEAALARVRARLAEFGQQNPPVEIQFSMPDQWSRHLFLALCRRYGLQPGQKLHAAAEFERARRARDRLTDDLFIVQCVKNERNEARLGMAVSTRESVMPRTSS